MESDRSHFWLRFFLLIRKLLKIIHCISNVECGLTFNFSGLMEALELELKLKTDNIKVTRICLGSTDTPLVKSLDDQVPEHA